MKKILSSLAVIVLSALLVASLASAQPGVGFSKTSPLIGTGSSGSPLRIGPAVACATNEILKWNGSAWACAADSGGSFTPSVQTSSSTGTLNDFALSAGTTLLRFTSASTTTVTGLARGGGNVDGDCVDIQYEGSSTFQLGSSGGTASNNFRFSNGVTTYSLGVGNANTSKAVRACYSTTTSRWTVFAESTQCSTSQVAQVDGSGVVTCAAIGDITGVTAGTGLTGGGTSGTPTLTLNMTAQSCSAGSFLSAATATGVFTCTAEPGDITGVTANSPLSGGGTTGAITVGMANGDRGDITTTTGTQTGDTWTIDNSAVTLAKIANIATSRILGRVTASSGVVEELTGTQATTLLDTFSTSTTTKGVVPGSNGGGSSVFLNGGGTWTTPTGDTAQSLTTAGTQTALNVSSTTTLLYWDPGGTIALQGIANGAANRRFKMVINAAQLVGVQIESGSASAANRIMSGDGLAWDYKGPVVIEWAYDTVNSRWTFGPATKYMPTAVIAGAATVGTTLGVTGATTLSSTMDVTGSTTFSGATNTFGDSNADEAYFRTNVYSVTTSSAANKPTISSCGTGPGVVGGSFGFIISPGTGSPTSCTATFADAFIDTPSCVVTPTTSGTVSGGVYMSAVSSSALTITTATGAALTGSLHVHCVGTSVNAGSP